MEKWRQIENLINKLLESTFILFKKVFTRLTPSKILNFLNKSAQNVANKKASLTKKGKSSKEKSLAFCLSLKDKGQKLAIKTKGSVGDKVNKVKSIDLKQLNFKKVYVFLAAFLTPLGLKIKQWYLGLKPTTIMGFVVVGSLGGLAGFNIYTQSKKIAEKAAAAREPASHVDKATAISKRPSYYLDVEKEFRIRNIKFPVGSKNKKGGIRTVSMDFTITTSNRYTREYLNENIHLVKDRLNSMLLPISPEFPLQEEGKMVVKEKIEKELNELINKLKIKGHVKKIHIHSILAG